MFKVTSSSTPGEKLARTCHQALSLCLFSVMLWFAFFVRPLNPAAVVMFGLAALVPLMVSLFANRKTVFQILLFGYWF